MAAGLRKRSVTLAGHATSLSIEEEFWTALRQVARRRGVSLNALVAAIDARRAGDGGHSGHGGRAGNLSSALRLFVLDCYRRGELTAEPPPAGDGTRSGAKDETTISGS